ncbi:DsbA family protein [Candidatus Bathyarchaeota archaeon]|nr:DsbA family protein [Candidatus Bathyarchaeota archaeon]
MIGRLFRVGCAVLLVWLAATGLTFAQQTDPKLWEEIQALKKGQEEIRKQLLEIKQLIQSRPAAAPAAPDVRNVPVDLGNRPAKGSTSAKLTLIEFSDYQCPFCARHTKDTNPQLQKEYVDSGKVRYVYFDMPLESIHKSAFKAAEATRCAGDLGKYWEMHERLFASQQKLEPWSEHAKALDLNATMFDNCMSSGKYAQAVRADIAVAQKLGITGTPSFLLALSDPKDPQKVTGLSLLRGAQPFNNFKTELDKALGGDAPAK